MTDVPRRPVPRRRSAPAAAVEELADKLSAVRLAGNTAWRSGSASPASEPLIRRAEHTRPHPPEEAKDEQQQQQEILRFKRVGRKKDFELVERVRGRMINVLRGLELHTNVFNAEEQKRIVDYIYAIQEKGRRGELRATKPSESARIFTLINDCKTTIWPAVTPGESFNGGGLALTSGQSVVFTAPVGWSGRIWGRTGCNFNKDGNGTCETGACGTALKCAASGDPPASLAEFTLASLDFYDVSLVDGFNLPMVVKPVNGKGNCSAAGCDGDLRDSCPPELSRKIGGKTVACRSACDVFNTDEYCCRGVYGNPSTCQPTYYSKKFKEACPAAYSYAYDDPKSILTCTDADYIITFCSNRKQTVCTYHDNKLICSGSNKIVSHIGNWLVAMLLYSISMWIGV